MFQFVQSTHRSLEVRHDRHATAHNRIHALTTAPYSRVRAYITEGARQQTAIPHWTNTEVCTVASCHWPEEESASRIGIRLAPLALLATRQPLNYFTSKECRYKKCGDPPVWWVVNQIRRLAWQWPAAVLSAASRRTTESQRKGQPFLPLRR